MRNRPRTTQKKQSVMQKSSVPGWIWWAIGVAAVALVGFVFISAGRSGEPASNPGQAVAIMPDTSHVDEGTDPGSYNTNPPSSGKHYPTTLKAGFYDEGSTNYQYPQGYLVHNLEHGYIIFWYNCALLDTEGCKELKEQLQEVLKAQNNLKVIAFPWSSIDVPVVATSWGRMLTFQRFDPRLAEQFVIQNRNKAPEPNAD